MPDGTVYRETRGVVKARSSIATWDGWPDDVRELVRTWNRQKRLRFVYLSAGLSIACPCSDCHDLFDSSGSTAVSLDDQILCDDCVISRARRFGILGRVETELEKCKRWQRNMQKKLVRYRHNALTEQAYVAELKKALEASERALADAEKIIGARGSAWVGSLVLEGVRICLRDGRWPDEQECARALHSDDR